MGAPAHLKPKHKGKALVAGGIAGVCEISMTYPTEFVKTSMQLSKTPKGVGQIVSETMKASGPMGFYRGLPSMVYFAAPKAAIRFSSFEAASGALVSHIIPQFISTSTLAHA